MAARHENNENHFITIYLRHPRRHRRHHRRVHSRQVSPQPQHRRVQALEGPLPQLPIRLAAAAKRNSIS
jgi:hypothetical protein